MLINTDNLDKNKEFVAEIKDRISDLKDRIKEMSETEKKKNAWEMHETLKIIKIFFDCNKDAQNFFSMHQKLIKEKW